MHTTYLHTTYLDMYSDVTDDGCGDGDGDECSGADGTGWGDGLNSDAYGSGWGDGGGDSCGSGPASHAGHADDNGDGPA